MSTLHDSNKKQMTDPLIEVLDIFANHRNDVGYNSEITKKLTPKYDKPLFSQNPPTPVLKIEEIQVELALP